MKDVVIVLGVILSLAAGAPTAGHRTIADASRYIFDLVD